jgi:hypothetical protein
MKYLADKIEIDTEDVESITIPVNGLTVAINLRGGASLTLSHLDLEDLTYTVTQFLVFIKEGK